MKEQPPPGGHFPFEEMTPLEIRAWIQTRRAALQKKMQRERAYLDKRAAHGRYTPTDEAYEQDQHLEAEIIALLDAFERHGEGWS